MEGEKVDIGLNLKSLRRREVRIVREENGVREGYF